MVSAILRINLSKVTQEWRVMKNYLVAGLEYILNVKLSQDLSFLIALALPTTLLPN
jgi:hypothetical protein